MLSTAEALNKSNIYIPKEELEGIIESIAHIVHYFLWPIITEYTFVFIYIKIKKTCRIKNQPAAASNQCMPLLPFIVWIIFFANDTNSV